MSTSTSLGVNRKGFTLIELLIAVTIVAVLASIGLVSYSKSQQIGRDGKRKQDLRALQTALEVYYQKNKAYPATSGWVNSTSGGSWIPGLDTSYINQQPLDPSNSSTNCNATGNFLANCFTYGYFSSTFCDKTAAGGAYILATRLENTSDPQAGGVVNWNNNPSCPWPASTGTAGVFAISSP